MTAPLSVSSPPHRDDVEDAAQSWFSQREDPDVGALNPVLTARLKRLESQVRRGDERRRAMLHIIRDLNHANKHLADQRKAMIHILGDYEQNRRRLEGQATRLDNSRRALLHILQDSNKSNLRLADTRKAMIHIMDDLRKTTESIQQRERELRDKQEQLVQAGKLATLGELTTGVAHELNNPLNNIGLFLGNVIDLLNLAHIDKDRMLRELYNALQQVRKATEIISHLRTFGRAAPVSREPVSIHDIITSALSLIQEQFRLRQIQVTLRLDAERSTVIGSAIQLEQVFINLLTNARDALANAPVKLVSITTAVEQNTLMISLRDSGPGIPPDLEQRVFDPFFTTKEVGAGTGLGLSITYGIVKDHGGSISVVNSHGGGATFVVHLPLSLRAAA
jgi:C4-dicarboxylate-specific signal transduction histidine kinase